MDKYPIWFEESSIIKYCENLSSQISQYSLSRQLTENPQQVCFCYEFYKVMMANIGFKRKDNQSKSKKLNQSTITALNKKVRPKMLLTSSYALI